MKFVRCLIRSLLSPPMCLNSSDVKYFLNFVLPKINIDCIMTFLYTLQEAILITMSALRPKLFRRQTQPQSLDSWPWNWHFLLVKQAWNCVCSYKKINYWKTCACVLTWIIMWCFGLSMPEPVKSSSFLNITQYF